MAADRLNEVIRDESHLIWQRFNVMVGANTVVVGLTTLASRDSLSAVPQWIRAGGGIVGLLLCVSWWFLISPAWSAQCSMVDESVRLDGSLSNPMVHYRNGRVWRQWDPTRLAAQAVVLLYAVGYGGLFWWAVTGRN
ncbi:MAG: hypothetical protein KGK34_09405 [Chloroflexota bacterium]|nr:hypothetical protein [Chloroflexota bacterium]